jgi:hypothetical protein
MSQPFETSLRALNRGERFGRLVVVSRGEDGFTYLLRCDCGTHITLRAHRLIGSAHSRRTTCGSCDQSAPRRGKSRSGLPMVEVVGASLLRRNSSKSFWDLELACGHKKREHIVNGQKALRSAGCAACGEELSA